MDSDDEEYPLQSPVDIDGDAEMEDMDEDVDAEGEPEDDDEDADGEPDDDENDNDNDADNENDNEETTAPSPRPQTSHLIQGPDPRAKTCNTYEITPYMAAPHATSVNVMAATPCMRWLFTGGSDGYVRKFDFFGSMNGKLPLTVAQRHPFVDTVTRAGVLVSYWENDMSGVPSAPSNQPFSPVYSLAVHSQAIWALTGLQSGHINLQTVRHEEGRTIHLLQRHTAPVSVLRLAQDETSVLSGGWDKNIYDWDLNTGNLLRTFEGCTGQVSTIAFRPEGGVPIPVGNSPPTKTPLTRTDSGKKSDGPGSPDSLFDDVDDDDDAEGEAEDVDALEKELEAQLQDFDASPKADEPDSPTTPVSQSTFLASSYDGNITLHDRRSPTPITKLGLARGVPPWCMTATWSIDGNSIFVGRRNQSVEEYSLHSSPSQPIRTIRLPANSGAVSAVYPMPNARHLVCASNDNIRLYDLKAEAVKEKDRGGAPPFWIVPGHHGGVVSGIMVDPTCRFLLTTGGNRGWEGTSTDVLMCSEIEYRD
ncbi:Transcription factor spt8 [Saitoella coloradoensis]